MSVDPPRPTASSTRPCSALAGRRRRRVRARRGARLRRAARARDPRPGAARPRRPRRRSSPTAPARAPRSASSPPAGPSPCCAVGRTSSRRTSTTSAATCCATACCSSYEALADGVDVEDVVERVVRTVLAPRVTPTQDGHRAGGRVMAATAATRTDATAGDVASSEATLRQLELRVARKLDGLLHGDYQGLVPAAGHRGRRRPRSTTRATTCAASTGTSPPARARPHVRDTIADRELETWFVVDGSASLDFGTAGSRSATSRSRPRPRSASSPAVPATGSARSSSTARARRSRHRGPAATRCSASSAGWSDGRATAPGRASLASALRARALLARRRGLVVVISDLLDPTAGPASCVRWRPPRRRRRSRQRPARARACPPSACSPSSTPRPGGACEVQTARARRARAVRGRRPRQRDDAKAAVRSARAAYLELSTDRDWLLDVVRFVAMRRRLR